MAPYEGLLDSTRKPHWTVDGLPLVRFYDYESVATALTDPRFSHQILPLPQWLLRYLSPFFSGPVLQPSGAKHDLLRSLIGAEISQSAVNALGDSINRRADELVTHAQTSSNMFDLARLTDQITYEVICSLLGAKNLNTEVQRLQFFNWMEELCAAPSPQKMPRQPHVWKFLDAYVQDRLASGQNEPIDDLLSSKELTPKEKSALLHFVMTSATVTTSYTICAAWIFLKTMPDQRLFEEIRQNALNGNGALVTRAYNEALRCATPASRRPIRVLKTTKLGGKWLVRGQLIDVCFASANRDKRFERPDAYNPVRPAKPRHLGFGLDEYECPGQGLSSKVARAVLAALFRYASEWTLDEIESGGRLLLRMQTLTLRRPG